MITYKPLRMIAEDEDDLQIIAACLQDALIPLSGMEYDQEEKNFYFIANRFCWECSPEILEENSYYARVPTGLTFSHVTNIQIKELNLRNKNELVNLLTIHNKDENSIHLIFSGGAEIKLTVNQLYCRLKDVDEPYHTPNKPSHDACIKAETA